jgi:galactofuranose transport system ATP-binding protein
VVTSSEMEELLALTDRLVMLNEGATQGGMPTAGAHPDDVLAVLAGQATQGPERDGNQS